MRTIAAVLLISLAACSAVNAGIMYGVAPFDVALDSNLYTINTQTGTATLVGPTGQDRLGGLAFDSAGVLYGYTSGALYTIDTSTALATRVGLLGISSPEGGLAFHPTTGVLYATSSTLSDTLLTINPSTGAATTVGPLGAAGRDVSGLAFAADGTLYGVALRDGNADQLITINTATGAATAIGSLGTNIPTAAVAALEFDPQTGILYYSDNSSLYTVNPVSGAATLIGPHGVTGLAGLAAIVPEPSGLLLIGLAATMCRRR